MLDVNADHRPVASLDARGYGTYSTQFLVLPSGKLVRAAPGSVLVVSISERSAS